MNFFDLDGKVMNLGLKKNNSDAKRIRLHLHECCKELWDILIFMHSIYMLKGIQKEALKHFPSTFREIKQLASRLNAIRSCPVSRNMLAFLMTAPFNDLASTIKAF